MLQSFLHSFLCGNANQEPLLFAGYIPHRESLHISCRRLYSLSTLPQRAQPCVLPSLQDVSLSWLSPHWAWQQMIATVVLCPPRLMDALLGRRLVQRDSLPSLLMKCHGQHRKDRSMVQASIKEKRPERIGSGRINTKWQRGAAAALRVTIVQYAVQTTFLSAGEMEERRPVLPIPQASNRLGTYLSPQKYAIKEIITSTTDTLRGRRLFWGNPTHCCKASLTS